MVRGMFGGQRARSKLWTPTPPSIDVAEWFNSVDEDIFEPNSLERLETALELEAAYPDHVRVQVFGDDPYPPFMITIEDKADRRPKQHVVLNDGVHAGELIASFAMDHIDHLLLDEPRSRNQPASYPRIDGMAFHHFVGNRLGRFIDAQLRAAHSGALARTLGLPRGHPIQSTRLQEDRFQSGIGPAACGVGVGDWVHFVQAMRDLHWRLLLQGGRVALFVSGHSAWMMDASFFCIESPDVPLLTARLEQMSEQLGMPVAHRLFDGDVPRVEGSKGTYLSYTGKRVGVDAAFDSEVMRSLFGSDVPTLNAEQAEILLVLKQPLPRTHAVATKEFIACADDMLAAIRTFLRSGVPRLSNRRTLYDSVEVAANVTYATRSDTDDLSTALTRATTVASWISRYANMAHAYIVLNDPSSGLSSIEETLDRSLRRFAETLTLYYDVVPVSPTSGVKLYVSSVATALGTSLGTWKEPDLRDFHGLEQLRNELNGGLASDQVTDRATPTRSCPVASR